MHEAARLWEKELLPRYRESLRQYETDDLYVPLVRLDQEGYQALTAEFMPGATQRSAAKAAQKLAQLVWRKRKGVPGWWDQY